MRQSHEMNAYSLTWIKGHVIPRDNSSWFANIYRFLDTYTTIVQPRYGNPRQKHFVSFTTCWNLFHRFILYIVNMNKFCNQRKTFRTPCIFNALIDHYAPPTPTPNKRYFHFFLPNKNMLILHILIWNDTI